MYMSHWVLITQSYQNYLQFILFLKHCDSCYKGPVVCFYVFAFSNQTKHLQPLKKQKLLLQRQQAKSFVHNEHLMAAWKGIPMAARSYNPTSPPQTARLDSATVTSWLEVKWAEMCVGRKHTHTHPACSIWVIELTDSGMWMCVCWQTPLHPEWGLWLHLIMCVASVLSLNPRSLPTPSFSLPFTSPSPPSPPPLTTVPLGQSCGHTTWLLAAQECSWQKQPEARHVEKIQLAHSIHPPPTLHHLTFSH